MATQPRSRFLVTQQPLHICLLKQYFRILKKTIIYCVLGVRTGFSGMGILKIIQVLKFARLHLSRLDLQVTDSLCIKGSYVSLFIGFCTSELSDYMKIWPLGRRNHVLASCAWLHFPGTRVEPLREQGFGQSVQSCSDFKFHCLLGSSVAERGFFLFIFFGDRLLLYLLLVHHDAVCI